MKHTAIIEYPKAKLEKYEDMCFHYGRFDLMDYDIPLNENIKTWTTTFDDGMIVDIKIISSEDDVWTEGVLFDDKFGEIAHTDACDSLIGVWSFEVGNDIYEVDLKGC